MSNDHLLRTALAALAAEAPVELRRSEQVWHRYRRTRRRVVAASAVAVLAVVAGLALVAPGDGSRQGLVTRDPERTATTSPSPSGPGTRPPQPGSGASTASTEPAASSSPTSPVAAPVPGPGTPAPAQWPAGVLAYAFPSHARPGESVTTIVQPFAGDNGIESITVGWGDGTAPRTVRYGSCAVVGGRYYGSGNYPMTHEYATAGDYDVHVTVIFGGCGRPAQTRTTTAHVLVDDVPVAATALSPKISLKSTDVRSAPRPHQLAFDVDVSDPDGVVAFASIDWGDGTASVLRGGLPDWCRETPPPLDEDWPMHLEHTYPAGGSYVISLVVVTTTCDGGFSGGMSGDGGKFEV